MPKWQYKVVEHSMAEKDLNALGAQGWELVSHIVDWAANLGATTTLMIFKKHAEEDNREH